MDSNKRRTALSIVIPVYNGAASIGPLVDRLVVSLAESYCLEIVLVNDCSPDNSEEVCVGLYRKYRSIVKLYSLAKNVGEHNAVIAGLNKAAGDWAVIMDDDFQNPVSEVVKLMKYAEANSYDVVYTWYKHKRHNIIRNLGSRLNDKFANIMLEKPHDLYLSSFKAINRFLINELIKYSLPYTYIDGLILRTTSNIGKCEVEHHRRANGKSTYTARKLISIWLSMFTNFSILPLRIASALGFACAGVGFLVGVELFIERLFTHALPVGYALLIFLITIFAGAQLISIGMVGEYLGRLFLFQNRKPQYVIRREYDEQSGNDVNGNK